ncbi:MAG TPA: hypothetical protein VL137_17095 [Polyangiaceae bacterium]|nr:hypothetical protein [Polyangiaceae bacterium]
MSARNLWGKAAQLLYVLPILALFHWIDRRLVQGCGTKSETYFLNDQLHRATGTPKAKVIVLGQSTMGQWLDPPYLSSALKLPENEVLDGHLGGCHQDCTWAEVQLLLHQKRHFEKAFFGLNLYEMCDSATWKRSLQHATMTPLSAVPGLFLIYGRSDDAAKYVSRFVGASLLSAYADPLSVQEHLRRTLLGKPADVSDWVATPDPEGAAVDEKKKPKEIASCSMAPAAIQVKVSFTNSLLDGMEQLADHNYFLLLPDRTSRMSGVHVQRWRQFRAAIAGVLAAHPDVQLVDLVTGGALASKYFRDSVHLNASGTSIQRKLFEKRLKGLRAQ